MKTYRISLFTLVLTLLTTGGSVLGQAQSDSSRHKIGELAWLAGGWQGSMPNGWFEDHWSEPRAGMMMGMFRKIGPDGKTVVLEFEQIIETPSGIEFRFKHFSADLEPWEESKQPLTLRLELFTVLPSIWGVRVELRTPRTGNQPERLVSAYDGLVQVGLSRSRRTGRGNVFLSFEPADLAEQGTRDGIEGGRSVGR